jgi:hypothetical protein
VIITAKIWCDDTAVRLRGAQGPGGVREGHRRRRPLRAPPHRALRLRRVELRVSTSSLAFFLHRARHQDKAEMTSLWMISDAAGASRYGCISSRGSRSAPTTSRSRWRCSGSPPRRGRGCTRRRAGPSSCPRSRTSTETSTPPGRRTCAGPPAWPSPSTPACRGSCASRTVDHSMFNASSNHLFPCTDDEMNEVN